MRRRYVWIFMRSYIFAESCWISFQIDFISFNFKSFDLLLVSVLSGVPHVTPLVDPVQVTQVLIERTSAVDLVDRNLLHEDLLGVRLWHGKLLLTDFFPPDFPSCEEDVLLDFLGVSDAGSET